VSQVAQCASGDAPLLSRVLATAGAAAAAPDPAHRAAGCALLASLVDSIGGRLAPHYAELCSLLAPRLEAAEAGPVRACAARAATALASSWCLSEEHAPAARCALLPPLLRALRAAAAHGSHGDGDADAAAAEALAAAARARAHLFTPHDASDAAHAALTLAAAPGAPLALRLQALQLLCALSEAASPGVVSAAVLAGSAISATLTSLCAPPPGLEEDDDAAQLCEAAADALGALATALPERAGVFSAVHAALCASHTAAVAAAHAHGHAHAHAHHADAAAGGAAHARAASLRALAAVAEPCRAVARPALNDTLLPAAAAALGAHNPPAVRAAAADALLALIIALPADVSVPPACGGILTVACAAASCDPDATLRASAASLIARLAAEMATDDVSPHLESAVAALLSGLGPSSCGALRAACAEALASLAACALDAFEPFAAACAGALAPLLSAPPGSASEDDIRGRAAATTALGAVMTAGGPALCAAAWDGASAAALEGFASGRGELRTAAHVFFMRVARAADEGFAPHLPSAVGAALASAAAAAAEAAAAVAAAEAAEAAEAARAGGGAPRRGPAPAVHTGGVEEACAAAEALGAYASATGGAFLPYLSDALRALDALLSHPHPGVRAAAARALPLALAPLRAAAASDADNAAAGAQLACRLLSRLAAVVCADAVPDVVAEACAAAADVAYAAVSSGAASHSADVAATVHATLAALDAVIEGTTACQADARTGGCGVDDDGEEEDDEDVHAELAATAEEAKGAIMHAVQRAAAAAPAPESL
jgi:hypothetical protein